VSRFIGAGSLVVFASVVMLMTTARAEAIVGGDPAPAGRWPWMVALLDRRESDVFLAQDCGGTVIGARRVLTAGHCVLGKTTGDVAVLIGRTRLTAGGGRRVRVTAISVFPDFVSRRERGLDAAVLTLSADSGVAPLALAHAGEEAAWAPGTPAWTMGWGRLNARPSPGDNDYYADRLRELEVPVVSDDACESVYGGGGSGLLYRPAWIVCAGTAQGLTGPCSGDSGGPLVVGGPDAWLQVGILQGADSCAAAGYYDLYTRVDRVGTFALGTDPTSQPDPVARPRIRGRLVAGARVRCTRGRWRGGPARFSERWTRLGDRSGHGIGDGTSHRLTARDVRRGVTCTVTATNRGGFNTVAAEPLRPK
jgi:secreted trypsin-like serine protease